MPQFYDVQDRKGYRRGSAIATPISAKWGPLFDRHKKRFRIGISTFGRARLAPREDSTGSGYKVAGIMFSDLKPLEVAVDPAFELETSKTEAQELVLRYRATRKTRIAYNDFETGDRIEFVVATQDSIRAAVEQARLFGGYCAGVVFFRWPAFNETLAVQPDDVLTAAGVLARQPIKRADLRVVDGGCAAVYCVDLYLVHARSLAPRSIRYWIHSSSELEYFLPKAGMPVRMAGPSRIELRLPPYCGSDRLLLGRAVTAKRADFVMREEQ